MIPTRFLQALCVAASAFLLVGCPDEKPRAEWARVPGLENEQAADVMEITMGPQGPSVPQNVQPENSEISASKTEVVQTGQSLGAAGITFTIPEGWISQPPASPQRLAQFELPGTGGPAEMAIFHFGAGQGGAATANIERWIGQFKNEDSTSTSPLARDIAEIERDGLKIFLVKTSGTYDPGSMGPAMPAAEPKPDYALFGMIVEGGPEGTIFAKATGPRRTMEEQNNRLEEFALSVRRLN